MMCRKEKSCPCWDSNADSLVIQQVASHYTDCIILIARKLKGPTWQQFWLKFSCMLFHVYEKFASVLVEEYNENGAMVWLEVNSLTWF
jgi:hypothetical protein